jgi:hypothetical protein
MPKDYTDILDKLAAAKPKPPEPELKTLVSIEGGRHIEARNVEVVFRDEIETALADCECLAGFVVLCVDDQGFVTGSAHIGKRIPYTPKMFIDEAHTAVTQLVNIGGA